MKDILESLYPEISVEVSAELLEARVKGTQLALRGMSASRSVGLAILAHRSQQHETAVEWLAERMENGGAGLNRGHAQEIGILATAVLLKSWQGAPTAPASAAALAIRSGEFLGWKLRVPGLAPAATSYLDRAALEVRRSEPAELGESQLPATPEKAFPEDGGYSAEDVRALHRDLLDLREDLETALNALSTAQRAGAEQTSVLWWLFGERLLDGRRWSKPSEAARPLELARDLFRLTQFVPGPRGARNFLIQAIARTEMDAQRDLTIGGALRVLDADSKLRAVPVPEASALLALPILSCVHRLEYPAQARPASLHRSAAQIAEQLYGELLIGRAITDSDDE